jgi:Phage protein (N4 Gp49/phage Sf6 gene 66) family
MKDFMHQIHSPDNTDPSIERAIQAKGLTAPRVTPADLQANISGEYFFTGDSATAGCPQLAGLAQLTFCILVLKNGFTVTGESACASPENFDAAIGRRIARENAEQKIWPLMGYALKEQLHTENHD